MELHTLTKIIRRDCKYLKDTAATVHVPYETCSSQRPRIPQRTASKASWNQDQLQVALAAAATTESGRKIQDVVQQFDIHEATLRKRLKLNLTENFTEEQESELCNHFQNVLWIDYD
jgi:hypothetical protein